MVKIPKQGDILKLNTAPRQGHEQTGFRPYIVLSNNIVADNSNIVTVAPISTTERVYPLYLKIESANMKTVGQIMLDQLTTIDYQAREIKFVEHADDDLLDKALSIARVVFEKNN